MSRWYYLVLEHNGKEVLHTKISHGGKHDLEHFHIKQMSVQCRLDKKQFMDLAKCPMSREKYLQVLKGKGLLT